ncbi:MAG: DNA recombination protein RmuC [Sinobacteraceae bacterium]|nr:DNA recombination protein RmuC [Nevskiaceae bacterium]
MSAELLHLSAGAALLLGAIALTCGGLGGFLYGQLRASRRIQQLRVELEAAHVRLEAESSERQQRALWLEDSQDQLRTAFDSLATQSLRTNSELFLRLARESLHKDQALAAGELKQSEAAIAQLIAPLQVALQKSDQQVQALERERRDAMTSLRSQIEALAGSQSLLQQETRNLVTALRRPEVRGRWGELTLRRLVELTGMSAHCDFAEQLQVTGPDGALRPDLVVHLPDCRDIIVDVKTPLDAFLGALEAATEERRRSELRRHAQQVEARVRQLSAKGYWQQFALSPEFTVLFLPGDQFLGAALAERPELLDNALRQNVIIATPSTLMALLKTTAYGWRQSAVARNAAQIREIGQELYRRLGQFTAHLGRTGKQLGAAVEAYNCAVGSLERQLLPHARRFTELGVTDMAPLSPLDPIDELARTPLPGSPEAGTTQEPGSAPGAGTAPEAVAVRTADQDHAANG